MSTNWLCKFDSGEFDDKGEPVQYWFTHTLGTLDTVVHMGTNKYWWEGESADKASGILLEPVMPIKQTEQFMPSEYESWEAMCKYWANKN